MANQKQPDDERQAELVERAEERKSEYLRQWLKDPAYRAALHSRDEEVMRRTSRKVAYA